MKQKITSFVVPHRQKFLIILSMLLFHNVYAVYPGENLWHVFAQTSTEVEQLAQVLAACCAEQSTNFANTFTALEACCGCKPDIITESTTIITPGTYCVANDFVGSITLAADNVTLDLNGHTISTGGITVASNNVMVKNGRIINGSGVNTTGTLQNIAIQDLQIIGGSSVISASSVTNLVIERVNANGAGLGITVRNCDACLIQNCQVIEVAFAAFECSADSVGTFRSQIRNCSAINAAVGFRFAEVVCNVDNCFVNSVTTGYRIETITVNNEDIYIRNSVAKNTTGSGFFVNSSAGLGLQMRVAFSGCISENTAFGFAVNTISSATDNCVIENCIARNGNASVPSGTGYSLSGTNNCTLYNCFATGFSTGFSTSTALRSNVIGCRAINNSTGFVFPGGTGVSAYLNISALNTSTRYSGTGGATSAPQSYIQNPAATRHYGDNLKDVTTS